MRHILLKSLCVLILIGTGHSISFGNEIDDLRAEYSQYGLKVPDANMFGTSHPSLYFSASEMGNENDDYAYFLANYVFWAVMDEFRANTGEMVINSGYRPPGYNRSLVDSEGNRIASDQSIHQYGAATDINSIDGVRWRDMTETQKDEVFVELGVVATAMQGTYGSNFYIEAVESNNYLHLELMGYCDFDDNWI